MLTVPSSGGLSKVMAVPVAVDPEQAPAAQENSFLPDQVPEVSAPAPASTASEIDLPDKPSPLETSYSDVSQTDASRNAKIIDLSQRLDQPAPFVDKNLPQAEKAAQAPHPSFFSELDSQYPGTSNFLADPANMAVAHDDMQNVADHEKVIQKTREAHGILDSFASGLESSVAGLAVRHAMPDITLSKDPTLGESLAHQAGTLIPDLPVMAIGGIIGAVPGAAAGTAVAGPVGTVLGTAAGANAMAFALPAAIRQSYIEQYQNGDIKNSRELFDRIYSIGKESLKQGAIGALTGPLGVEANAVLGPLAGLGAEVAALEVSSKAIEDQPVSGRGLLENTLIIGGMHAAGVGGSKLYDAIQSEKALKTKELAIEISDLSEQSRLRTRPGGKYEEAISQITENSGLQDAYVPVEALKQYFQSKNLNADKVLESLGVKDQFAEADATNGDIKIPLSKLVGSEHLKGLSDDIKFSPEDLTPRQVGEKQADVQKQMQELDTQTPQDQVQIPGQEKSTAVFDDVKSQLIAAGQGEKEASANAQLHQSFFSTLGEKLGVDPLSLSKLFPLDIKRRDSAALKLDTSFDFGKPLDTTGKTPEEAAQLKEAMQTAKTERLQMARKALDALPDASTDSIAAALGLPKNSVRPLSKGGRKGAKVAEYSREDIMAAIGDNSHNQPGETDIMGRLRINGREFGMDIFKTADRSTFIHETGHYFLEVLGHLAGQDSAPQAIKDDYGAILKWLGVDSKDGIQGEHHEKFARGFEAYLREGKAPNATLKNAFYKFKQWLVKIYKHAKELNVELSPEIRGVMDRLLSTEEEIARANREIGHSAISMDGLPKELQDKLSELSDQAKQQAEQTLLKPQIEELTAKRQEFLKNERDIMTEQSKRDVADQPFFKAVDEVSQMKGGKKSQALIAEKFMAGELNNKDAAHFEVLAETYDLVSGENLARKIIDAEKNKLFDKEVNSRVELGMSRYADIMHTDQIKVDALHAVHNEHMIELMALERRYFKDLVDKKHAEIQAKQAGRESAKASAEQEKAAVKRYLKEAKVEASAAKESAQSILSKKPLKEATNARKYITAERNSAVKAEKAMQKKDYEAVAKHKNEQMLNHALAMEAMKAREEFSKSKKYLDQFAKRGADTMGMPYGFMRQIDALLGKSGLAGPRVEDSPTFIKIAQDMAAKGEDPTAIANATGYHLTESGKWTPETLKDLVEREIDNYNAIDIPDSVIENGRHFRDMPISDFRDLRDAVKTIESLGKKYDKFTSLEQRVGVREAAKAIRESVERNIGSPYADKLGLGTAKRPPGSGIIDPILGLADATAPTLNNMLTICEYIDSKDPEGPAKKFIYRIMKEAEDRKIVRHEQVKEQLGSIFEKHFAPGEFEKYKSTKEDFPELGLDSRGRVKQLTKEQQLGILLNWGNEGNRQRVRDGYGVSDATLEKIINRLPKRDFEFAQEIWNHLNTYWPEIVKLEMDVNGVEPKAVEPTRLISVHGEYAGGYYPIATDPEKSTFALNMAEKKNDLFKQYSTAKAHTEKGHTKARAAMNNVPIDLSTSVLFDHLENVVHDIEFRRAVIDVNRVLSHPDVKTSITNALDVRGYKAFNEWLKSIASEQSDPVDAISRGLRWFRFKTTLATLGFRVTTLPLDIVGNLGIAAHEIGVSRLASAIKEFAVSPGDIKEFVESNSPRMRKRASMRDRDLNDMSRRIIQGDSKLQKFAFWTQSFADEAVTIPLWNEVYKHSLGKFDHQTAVNLADEAVTKTVGSGSKLDQAAIQRGAEYKKVMTMYYSFMSTMYNRFWLEGKTASGQLGSGQGFDALQTMAKAGMLLGFSILNENLWKELFHNGKQDDKNARAKRVAARVISQPFSYVPIARDVAPFVIDRAMGMRSTVHLTPLEQAAENILLPVGHGIQALANHNQANPKLVEETAKAASNLAGTPQSLNTVVFNFLDWQREHGELTWKDFVTRRTKK